MFTRGFVKHFTGGRTYSRPGQKGPDHTGSATPRRRIGSVSVSVLDGGPHIGLVVEGQGDKQAIPILLRKHLASRSEYRDLIGKPIPCHGRGAATVPGGIEGYVATAAARPGCRAVLVIFDGDEDPPCQLGPQLVERSHKICSVPVHVSLAERCFEDWLYASTESLDIGIAAYAPGQRGLIAHRDQDSPRQDKVRQTDLAAAADLQDRLGYRTNQKSKP